MMKKTVVAAAVAALAAGSAFAQSTTVTLYGKIDTSINFTSNQNAAGDSLDSLSAGQLSGSRWGLKGSEDLGGGLSTVFTFEGGFSPDTGSLGQGSRIFGRQVFVGLNGNFGTVSVGRQYGVLFDSDAVYDPIGVGNGNGNSWQLAFTGVRYDNSLKYTVQSGPVSFGAMYAFGEQAGSTSKASTAGADVAYAQGPFAATLGYQQTKDASDNAAKITEVGGKYSISATTLYLGYIYSDRDAGFSPTSGLTSSLNISPVSAVERKDKVITLGVSQGVGAWTLTLAYLYDNATGITSTTDGKYKTLYGLADYSLSKRTDVYVSFDNNRFDGGAAASPLGWTSGNGGTVNNVSLGIRHAF